MHNYDWLIARLDAFIRKYYANKVIRGSLVFISSILFYFLTVSICEYFLYLPVFLKIVLVVVFLGMGTSALAVWVIIPLAAMAKLGKTISHEQAASIIGIHFPEISDKLLNILQLKRNPDNNASRELAEAGINQKIAQISIIPIAKAVDFTKNKKYVPYLTASILTCLLILLFAPGIFSESSKRLLQPTKEFKKPAPFQFVIKNPKLVAVKNSDFTVVLNIMGDALPSEVFIELGNDKMLMQSNGKDMFQYTIRNVAENMNFRFYSAGYYSDLATLMVVRKPTLKNFKVELTYPSYTGRKNETRTNLGDMAVPAGTVFNWALETETTDNATIKFGSGNELEMFKNGKEFSFQNKFMTDTVYTLLLSNKESEIKDSFKYQVQVIPDQFPVVQLQQIRDSISGKQILITGTAADDYGITKVNFVYEVTDKKKALLKKIVPVPIVPGSLVSFNQYFDIQLLQLLPGQKVSYFIEAWDNDGVHGSKSSRSELMSYQMYNPSQIDSAINENQQQINSGISSSSQRTKQLQNEYKDMQTKMLQSDKMDWEQEQNLNEMMKSQQELKTQLEKIKDKFEEQMQQSEQKQYSEDIKDKQKDLQKQLDNLLNDELKEQMKKLQELMQKLNKEQAVEAMKKMMQDNKLFKMDMERLQTLMKKLQMQMQMENLASKIEDLANKENDLKNETEKEKKSDGELAKEQKEIKDKLDKLMKEEMKDIDKLAKENKQEKQLDEPKEQSKDASEEMKKSEEQLDKKDKSSAKKSQENAAKKLQKMASSLRKNSNSMSADEIDIDIKATRQILSNLIRLSFDQEDLMQSVRETSPTSQVYVFNQEKQNQLHHNSLMIRDSMFTLSKKISKISANINRETSDLEYNMQLAVDKLEDRNIEGAIVSERYIMTHTNNLALMLNEILANLMQMQNQSNEGGGMGSCKKPGGKTPKPGSDKQLSDIITEQTQIGNSMKQMQEKKGNKGGKKEGEKPGDKGGQKPGGAGAGEGGEQGGNENGDAEQLARLADQQAMLRRKIQELSSFLNSKGMGGLSKELRDIEQKMDKNETDLVNRRLTSELIMRQKDILTRLLETDKAMREQEQDEKRSSKKGEELQKPMPPELQKYVAEKKKLLELYRTVPPQLKPYYRDMVDYYFQIIGNKK